MKSQEILANATRLGPVHLRVVDISAALPVWRDVVGLSTLTRSAGSSNSASTARPLSCCDPEGNCLRVVLASD